MAERTPRWVGIAAVVCVVVAAIAWRSLDRAGSVRVGTASAVVPGTQLAQLLPYAGAASDSVRAALEESAATDSVVVRRDPFVVTPERVVVAPRVAPSAKPVEREALRVSATLVSSARRAALINDMLVYVGDPVPGGGTLTSVERDRVTVTDATGAARTLVVKESND